MKPNKILRATACLIFLIIVMAGVFWPLPLHAGEAQTDLNGFRLWQFKAAAS